MNKKKFTVSLINQLYTQVPILTKITSNIAYNNGITYIVGGSIRDFYLNRPLKDIDLEVHGIPLETLEQILSQYSNIQLKGKTWGIISLPEYNIDCAIPRIDGPGRNPHVIFNPYLPIEKALARRDLTMNALALSLPPEKPLLYDPYNGIQDIENNILRAVNIDFFTQDPLRFFRLLRYIGIFGMDVDDNLKDACEKMNLNGLSTKKQNEEIKKIITTSTYQSNVINFLHITKKYLYFLILYCMNL
jgi:tRNA nucleotidyltransferase (CCA-adding enzyme)